MSVEYRKGYIDPTHNGVIIMLSHKGMKFDQYWADTITRYITQVSNLVVDYNRLDTENILLKSASERDGKEIFRLNQKIRLILDHLNLEIVNTPAVPEGLQIKERPQTNEKMYSSWTNVPL